MKHHVLTKTVALLLCALFLLGAVGSAAGILVMAEMNLYSRSYQDAWDENVEQWADGLAYNVGHRYASGALGGCNTQFLDQELGTGGYYDVFDMSRVGYAVKDAQGEVLQRQPLDPGTTPEYTFTFPFRGSYMRLVEEMTQQEWEQQQMALRSRPSSMVDRRVLWASRCAIPCTPRSRPLWLILWQKNSPYFPAVAATSTVPTSPPFPWAPAKAAWRFPWPGARP